MRHLDADLHQLILSNVLDGLDDLYDRRERAVINLWRLLVVSGPALGDVWEAPMAAAASDLRSLIGLSDEESNGPALDATDALRIMIADVP